MRFKLLTTAALALGLTSVIPTFAKADDFRGRHEEIRVRDTRFEHDRFYDRDHDRDFHDGVWIQVRDDQSCYPDSGFEGHRFEYDRGHFERR